MFSHLGFTEVALILAVALIIFGPKKLPDLGKSLGESIRSFKHAINDTSAPEHKGEGKNEER